MLKHGSQKTMARSLLFAAAASVFLLIPVHKYLVIVLMAVFGSLAAGSQLAPTVMTAETIDKDNRQGLKYREGMIIGLMGMAIRFPPAVSGLLIGELLKLAAYDSTLAVSMQPDAVNWILRVFFAFGLVFSSLATYYFNNRHSLKK
jgi:Na+/melibiose symporter-like transporter